jgi:hypothetical protein
MSTEPQTGSTGQGRSNLIGPAEPSRALAGVRELLERRMSCDGVRQPDHSTFYSVSLVLTRGGVWASSSSGGHGSSITPPICRTHTPTATPPAGTARLLAMRGAAE